MCGRFALYSSLQSIKEYADTFCEVESYQPSKNIAPGQNIIAIIKYESRYVLTRLKWGFVPHWAKDNFRTPIINTRSETIDVKVSFREAFQKRRCLIIINGFYEWKDGQPYYFRLNDRKLFTLGGIWQERLSEDNQPQRTCSIITTKSQNNIHHRMPVIINREDEINWLTNPLLEHNYFDSYSKNSLIIEKAILS